MMQEEGEEGEEEKEERVAQLRLRVKQIVGLVKERAVRLWW